MLGHRPAGVTDADGTLANGIFISYRRDDTSGHVIALMEPLSARFGVERIFKDTDSIPAGRDFVEEVKQQLGSCAVVLVVIGREWLTVSHPRHPGRRLDDANDLVRLEVSTALATPGMLVIPVLVDRATMPSAEDLPDDLQALSRRNYIELTDTRWRTDTEHLLHRIAQTMPVSGFRLWWKKVSAYSVHALVAVIVVLTGALATTVNWRDLASPTDTRLNPEPPPGSPAKPSPVEGTSGGKRNPPADAREGQTPAPEGASANTPPVPAPKTPDTRVADSRITAPIGEPAGGRTGKTVPPRIPDSSTKGVPPAAAPNRPAAGGVRQDETKDRSTIGNALERFRQAYNRKDEHGVIEVYPNVRADLMFRDLAQCSELDLVFLHASQVSFTSPDRAVVEVESTYGCRPTTGQGKRVSKPVTDTYFLTRQGGSWLIDARKQYVAVDRTRDAKR